MPECSCVECLEDQLRRFMPRLLDSDRIEIRIERRTGPGGGADPGRRHPAV